MNGNILVLGAGRSGKAVTDYLKKHKQKYSVIEDTRRLDSEQIVRTLEGVELIITSPGITCTDSVLCAAIKRNIKIVSELEWAAGLIACPVLAVTGTNGKSTTTALLGEILKSVNKNAITAGNIGVPLTAVAGKLTENGVVACEVSSFMLEYCPTFKPHIACILNITPDHLDRHFSMANYIKTKFSISSNQTADDYLLLNADDGNLAGFSDTKAQIYYVSLEKRVEGAYLSGDTLYIFDKPLIKQSELALLGRHNVCNALFAGLSAYLYGIEREKIAETLKSFTSLKNRLEVVAVSTKNDRYINDSKATNINSTLTAVSAMTYPSILILGGSDKGYEYDELFEKMENDKVKYIIVCGETRAKILRAAKSGGLSDNVFEAVTLREAVLKAHCLAGNMNDSVNILLSPASASFDEFENYEKRGEFFTELVKSLV